VAAFRAAQAEALLRLSVAVFVHIQVPGLAVGGGPLIDLAVAVVVLAVAHLLQAAGYITVQGLAILSVRHAVAVVVRITDIAHQVVVGIQLLGVLLQRAIVGAVDKAVVVIVIVNAVRVPVAVGILNTLVHEVVAVVVLAVAHLVMARAHRGVERGTVPAFERGEQLPGFAEALGHPLVTETVFIDVHVVEETALGLIFVDLAAAVVVLLVTDLRGEVRDLRVQRLTVRGIGFAVAVVIGITRVSCVVPVEVLLHRVGKEGAVVILVDDAVVIYIVVAGAVCGTGLFRLPRTFVAHPVPAARLAVGRTVLVILGESADTVAATAAVHGTLTGTLSSLARTVSACG